MSKLTDSQEDLLLLAAERTEQNQGITDADQARGSDDFNSMLTIKAIEPVREHSPVYKLTIDGAHLVHAIKILRAFRRRGLTTGVIS